MRFCVACYRYVSLTPSLEPQFSDGIVQQPATMALYLELVTKRLIVEEEPWVVVLVVPVILELAHALHNALELRVAHQTYQRCAWSAPASCRREVPPRAHGMPTVPILFQPSYGIRCGCVRGKVGGAEDCEAAIRRYAFLGPCCRRGYEPYEKSERQYGENGDLTLGCCPLHPERRQARDSQAWRRWGWSRPQRGRWGQRVD